MLVTGGSQGMGKAVAILLAKKGADVIIVARNVHKLEDALKEISVYIPPASLTNDPKHTTQASAIRPSSQRFHYLSADLTSPTEASRILSETTAWNSNKPPDILFCCAGASHPGLFVDLPPDTLKEQMDTNYFSSAYIAHAAIRSWLPTSPPPPKATPHPPPEPKHIIFTSSLAAFLPIAGYSAYAPPKTALRALADSLTQELLLYDAHTPIRTHAIFPGTIFSPGLALENQTKHPVTTKLEESDGGQTPGEVARAAIRGLEAGEALVTTNGLLGMAMKAGMLGGSWRNGWGVVDTVLGWVVLVVLVFVRRDMDGTVRGWGKGRGA